MLTFAASDKLFLHFWDCLLTHHRTCSLKFVTTVGRVTKKVYNTNNTSLDTQQQTSRHQVEVRVHHNLTLVLLLVHTVRERSIGWCDHFVLEEQHSG